MGKQTEPPFAANPQATVKRPKKPIAGSSTEPVGATKVEPPRKPAAVRATEPAGGMAPAKAPAYGKRLDRTVTASPMVPPKRRTAEEPTRSVGASKVRRRSR